MINISTVPENRQGSLKLHHALPPNENPTKLDIYPHPIQGGFYVQPEAFSSKVRQHHTEPSYSSVSLIGPLLSNRLDDTGWLAKGREWHALGREQMGV